MAAELAQKPSLDGMVVGDSAWESVIPATGFTQVQPNEGRDATRKTGVFIVYNEFDEQYPGAPPTGREVIMYSYLFDVFK